MSMIFLFVFKKNDMSLFKLKTTEVINFGIFHKYF